MKLLKIVSAIAVAVVVFFISYSYSTPQEAEMLGGGSGTINQLEQWKKSGGYITQNVSGAILKLTGYESNGNCLVTDINGVVSTTTCGTGSGTADGVSNWLYNGSRLSPSTTVGIGVFASSTIGNGTGAGGLTVNGGATTTGNAYFGGGVAMQGWALSTSTVVCMSPEQCQFQADGVEDDVQINQAILSTKNAGGGTVLIKSATYDISSASIKIYSNVTIAGEGDTTILRRDASSSLTRTIEVNQVIPAENFVIRDLMVDCNETGPIAGHYGIVLGQSFASSSNYHLRNLTIASSSAIGINAVYSDNFTIDNIRITSASQTETSDGIDIVYSRDFSVSNINLRTGDDGLVISASYNGVVNNIKNEGTSAGGTFRIGGNSSTVPTHDIVATNLVSIDNDTAVSISNVQTVNQQSYNIAVSNVSVVGGNFAVKVSVATSAIDVAAFKNVSISNVVASGTFQGVYVSNNNPIDGLKLSQIQINAPTSYGINIEAGKNISLKDISVSNSGSSGINIQSTDGINALENIRLQNVDVSSSTGRGIVVGDGVTLWATSSVITIDNSSFINNTSNGMELSSGTFFVRNSFIKNNGEHGILINPLEGGRLSHLENNTISGNINHGIFTHAFSDQNRVNAYNNKIVENGLADVNINLNSIQSITSEGYFGFGTSTPTVPFDFVFKNSISGIPYLVEYSAPNMGSSEQFGVVYGKSSKNSQGFNMLYNHHTSNVRRYLNIKPNEGTLGDGLVILANGNVGIGTTTPPRLLTVQGDGYFTNNVTAASSTFTNATSTTSFFSALGTFTNAVISTLLSVLNITITGLADIGAGVLEIPNGTAPTVDSVGELALDTTSNQLVLYGNEKKVIGNGNEYATFTYATTTAWTGTTTLPLGPAYTAETWNGIQCFTDVGTLIVQVGDGTNFTNANQSSTTVGTTNFTTNNTFTAGEKRYFRAGTPASSPTTISCTISKSLTAD